MTDERFADDPVLARAAAARPPLDEADLSPTGERAEAILARVIASPRPSPSARSHRSAWWSRRGRRGPVAFGGLALAAAVASVVLVFAGVGGPRRSPAGHTLPTIGTHPLPAADQIHLDSNPVLPRRTLRNLDRTPLGRAIAQQFRQIQQDIDTGNAAQNRRALQQLQFNQAACQHAAEVVGAVSVPPAQRYLQYDWVHGTRMQARLDGLFITALHKLTAGDRAAGERAEHAAGNLVDTSDLYTAYPMNVLGGNGGGPLPRVPGIEGPGGTRRAG